MLHLKGKPDNSILPFVPHLKGRLTHLKLKLTHLVTPGLGVIRIEETLRAVAPKTQDLQPRPDRQRQVVLWVHPHLHQLVCHWVWSRPGAAIWVQRHPSYGGRLLLPHRYDHPVIIRVIVDMLQLMLWRILPPYCNQLGVDAQLRVRSHDLRALQVIKESIEIAEVQEILQQRGRDPEGTREKLQTLQIVVWVPMPHGLQYRSGSSSVCWT